MWDMQSEQAAPQSKWSCFKPWLTGYTLSSWVIHLNYHRSGEGDTVREEGYTIDVHITIITGSPGYLCQLSVDNLPTLITLYMYCISVLSLQQTDYTVPLL